MSLRIITLIVLLGAVVPAAVLLPPKSTWEYTFSDPTGDPAWNTTTGVGGIWSSGPAPFGNTADPNFGPGTVWPVTGSSMADDLWVRTTVDLTGIDLGSVNWDLGVDNGYKLYVNGVLVSSANAEGFTFRWEYSGAFPAADLLPGLNVIALALEDHGGATAFDMQVTGDPIPEPSTGALMLAGVIFAAGFGRRRRR
jgi:hypothetical protein